MIDKIVLENFRCFSQTHEVRLAPLTILVGENSTGKSSFLAAIRAAWDLAQGKTLVDFNEDPFQLGAFQTIANYRGGRAGRATAFTIGLELPPRPTQRIKQTASPIRIGATFAAGGPQPVVAEWWMKANGFEVRTERRSGPNPSARLLCTTPSGSFRVPLRYSVVDPFISLADLSYIAHFAGSARSTRAQLDLGLEGKLPKQADLVALERLARSLNDSRGRGIGRARPLAIAPVRTRPRRAYDPISDTPSPEGEHIPLVLAKLAALEPSHWKSLSESISAFGAASGLFSELNVKRLGNQENSPFQLTVKVGGPAVNVVDVGYGVSQVLPVLVDSLNLPRNATLLLQQPEVHLHPKAQAELGTFLWNLVNAQHKQIVVETHSDYLVDRVRLDIRERRGVKAADVLILYFERQGSSVQVHEISI